MCGIYDEVKELFDNHVLECQKKLKGKKIEERDYQEKQIDIKLFHSYRVTDNMKILFEKLQLNEDYIDLGKTVGLLHDIGRFRQMLETGTYLDYSSFEKKQGISDHGDYGVIILFKEKLITKSNIPKGCYGILYHAIKYHGKAHLPIFFNHYLEDIKEYERIELNTFLSSTPKKHLLYLKLLSLYVRAIRDADKIDIYYQNLIGEFPLVRPYFYYEPKGESLKVIAKYWGISKQEIKECNHLTDDDISKKKLIKIPVVNIAPKKLEIPKKYLNLFFEGKVPPINELVNYHWYTFIAATLIRLNFLRDINFVSTLKILQEQQILNKLYDKYPSQYKPLVKALFEYAQEVLLEKTIKENENKIYIKKFASK